MSPHFLTLAALSLLFLLLWLLIDPDPAYSLRCLARENGVDLAALLWWRDYLAQVLAALWLRFLVWREGWPDRVREAFREEPGRYD